MKKILSLLLALVMCLSLCACGGGNDTPDANDRQEASNTPTESQGETTVDSETTEDPAIAAQRKSDYETALHILDSASGYIEALFPPDIQQAYELLSALGDYEQSAEYLSKIKILPNMLIYTEFGTVNAFDEERLKCQIYYGYTADGRIIYGPEDYYAATCRYYSYNDQGQVTEVQVGSAGFTDEKHIYNYENGVLTSVDILYADGDKGQHIYENGNLVRLIRPDVLDITYTYDQNGNLMSMESVRAADYNHAVIYTYSYEFDADGTMISKIESYDDGSYTTTIYTTTYTYENGNLVREDIQRSTGDREYITYTYGDYYCYDPEA